MLGIEFHPDLDGIVHGTVRAVCFGILAAQIPKWTSQRVREKEAGLDVDERFEMGLDDEDDEFGYTEGYVCAACDNTNEVRGCFFVAFVALCLLGNERFEDTVWMGSLLELSAPS